MGTYVTERKLFLHRLFCDLNPSTDLKNSVEVDVKTSDRMCLYVCLAGDGVLRCRLGDRSDQEHQRELSEGGVDRLHLQRDPQGEK